MSETSSREHNNSYLFMAEGGETGALIRATDWSRTPLGPPESWPASLKTTVGILLRSRQPMLLWWGPDLIQFYNDAYLPSFGSGKHPGAMGQRAVDCWREIWPLVWPQLDAVMRHGVASWNEDRLVPIIRDGRPEEVYWTYGYSPVLDDDGAIGGTLVVCTETTNHVLLERAQADRERLVNQLESAGRAKDEFLAMLGHELRNPLSPILTALQLMQLRGVRGADRERAIIERQVRHVVGLVDDLLDVSRITRGRLELKRERIRISHAVAKGIEQASPLIEQRRHRLIVEVPHDLHVDGDPGRLAQVVANLLTNAAKYTDVGGEIHIQAGRRDDELSLRVRDNGIGIGRDMIGHVFNAFVQERQQSDRARGGLGLGLAIVKSLVDAHGGSVEVHSEGAGCGTEFIVRLPIATGEPQLPVSTRVRRASGETRNGCRVLLVDDNEDAARLLCESLSALGHDVEVAFDAPSALDIAQRYVPNVAILDLGLPIIDGYELASRLRAQDGWGDVRFAALTGYGQQHDRVRSEDAGFGVHLVKPIDVSDVDATIRRLAPTHSADADASSTTRR